MAIQTENMINWQLKQIPWLFSVYLGNYILIMALGLGLYSYKRKKSEQNESPDQKPAPRKPAGDHSVLGEN